MSRGMLTAWLLTARSGLCRGNVLHGALACLARVGWTCLAWTLNVVSRGMVPAGILAWRQHGSSMVTALASGGDAAYVVGISSRVTSMSDRVGSVRGSLGVSGMSAGVILGDVCVLGLVGCIATLIPLILRCGTASVASGAIPGDGMRLASVRYEAGVTQVSGRRVSWTALHGLVACLLAGDVAVLLCCGARHSVACVVGMVIPAGFIGGSAR